MPLVLPIGCGDDGGPGSGVDAAVDAQSDASVANEGGSDAGLCEPATPVVPVAPTGVGVAYASHWWSDQLYGIRLDGQAPAIELNVDIGLPVRMVRIDPFSNRLFLVSEIREVGGYEARIYQLDVPESADSAITPPQLLGRIEYPASVAEDDYKKPLGVAIDGRTQRMYIPVAQISPPDITDVKNQLRVYDVSDPAQPREIESARTLVPGGIYTDIDPYRHLLFWSHSGGRARSYYFRVFDIADELPRELGGSPIRMEDVFPDDPDDQTGYQVRNPRVDFTRRRVYMAQAELTNSQLVGFEYPEFLPDGCESYADRHGLDAFTPLEDGFDVSAAPGDAPNLFGAYRPMVDWVSGGVIMSAAAYTPSVPRAAMVVSFSPDLEVLPTCEDYDGFGCHYRLTVDGSVAESPYRVTDGAACFDPTHRVFVGTDVSNPEENPGQFHLFKADSELGLTPWRTSDGDNLPTAGLVVGLDCHLQIQ